MATGLLVSTLVIVLLVVVVCLVPPDCDGGECGVEDRCGGDEDEGVSDDPSVDDGSVGGGPVKNARISSLGNSIISSRRLCNICTFFFRRSGLSSPAPPAPPSLSCSRYSSISFVCTISRTLDIIAAPTSLLSVSCPCRFLYISSLDIHKFGFSFGSINGISCDKCKRCKSTSKVKMVYYTRKERGRQFE